MHAVDNAAGLERMCLHPVNFLYDHRVLGCARARREPLALADMVPIWKALDAKGVEDLLLNKRLRS